ncbi:restriction endonuclease subunit S [Bacillus cereus]|uniref:restriction endonuclease subunit S n=1 Tax=Bacillus cereus TaxID=1396 RepID=UPI0011554E7B|nr:restriction endonuclease subunit S [Bacillus cereus]
MEFNEMQLENILEINPRNSLKKGTVAKKVAMEHLYEYVKKIQDYEITEFKSGSKFKNGDTLVARITPCLENGKTAYVDILDGEEIAFGSTEFFVVRAKQGKADSQFIYYLMRSPEVREITIQSMTGTSGRQRAQKEAILGHIMKVPDLDAQKKIGYILSLYDEKIESNKDIIITLEQLSKTLFKYWFIDFEFPNQQGEPYKTSGGEMMESELGKIPKWWTVKTINDFAAGNVITGKTPSTKKKEYYADKGMPFITIPDMHNKVFITEATKYLTDLGVQSQSKKIIPKNSICVSCIATPGLVILTSEDSLFNQQINSFTPSSEELYYLFFSLKNISDYIRDLGSSGSATLNLNKTQFSKIKIVSPSKDILNLFNNSVKPLFEQILELQKENQKLEQLRDTLLPKLLSGEIEIQDDLEVE